MKIDSNKKHFIPSGYSFGAIASGIKKSGKLDLTLIVSDEPCSAFGAVTQNLIRASCVQWNESRWGTGRVIVINSGNANACTGAQGATDTLRMAQATAENTDCDIDDVFVMSTGIIGELMPMTNIFSGIQDLAKQLGTSPKSVADAADGILTTDTFPKIESCAFEVDGQSYSILGIAKGAGMIGPKMATLLSVFLTDYPLSHTPENHTKFLKVVDDSFNRISVDGHTSTSDQVVLFAASPPAEKDAMSPESDELFFQQLTNGAIDLAKMIPSDGEGAEHLISIEVSGPQSMDELTKIAKTIADSPLVKTAIFGCDPNWGRIVSAAGYAGVDFDPLQTSLQLNGVLLYQNGTPVEFDAAAVSQSLKDQTEATIRLELGKPDNQAPFWTSDLTYDYVKINAEYHT